MSYVGARELYIVRKQQTDPSKFIFKRQELTFKLDPMITSNIGTNIHLCCFLNIGVSEFEYNLRIANWESVLINDPSAQNEGIVVKAEVGCVNKYDFTDFYGLVTIALTRKTNTVLYSSSLQHLSEGEETLAGGESVRF